jgi:hypothetical protein
MANAMGRLNKLGLSRYNANDIAFRASSHAGATTQADRRINKWME